MTMMMRIVLFLSLACLSLASCSPTATASCAGTTRTLFCGSCCCSAQDDPKLREAFLAEVKAHGYHDAGCRSQLKAYICKVCMAAAAPADDDPSSALPLQCAGAAAPPASTTRHDEELGGSSTLCVYKASTQAYDGVVPLQDGSGRLLCWRRNGQIWLATVDVVDPTGASVLRVGDIPLVDLSTRVSQDAAAARGRGLAGVAVHSSGRVFVSYYTTTDDGGAFLVVDQLLTATWSEHEVNRDRPNTAQTRTTRVFSMPVADAEEPLSSSGFLLDYYGGQILFPPTNDDSFLYLVTSPAQSDGQLQAKILRFRVGGMSSGNGAILPMEAQVYASLLGVPRRCAFDADRPHDIYCAIVKEDQEVVYLYVNSDSTTSSSATPPSASLVVAHQRPTPGTPPSLVGGPLYRGYADSTLTGSYIYMQGSEFWGTVASPARNYTTTRNLRVTCSATTASPCRGGDFAGGDFAGGNVTSFAEDADKNALLLATDGVYMVVRPSLCDADTHTKGPISTLLKWIIGVIVSLIGILGSYGVFKYKTCSCFNRTSNISVNGNNVNIHNGEKEIQITVVDNRESIHT